MCEAFNVEYKREQFVKLERRRVVFGLGYVKNKQITIHLFPDMDVITNSNGYQVASTNGILHKYRYHIISGTIVAIILRLRLHNIE